MDDHGGRAGGALRDRRVILVVMMALLAHAMCVDAVAALLMLEAEVGDEQLHG